MRIISTRHGDVAIRHTSGGLIFFASDWDALAGHPDIEAVPCQTKRCQCGEMDYYYKPADQKGVLT